MDSSTWTDAEALAYIASYADLRQALGADPEAGRRHYATAGNAEKRVISFDALKYIASYTDLIAAFGTDAAAGPGISLRQARRKGAAPVSTRCATSHPIAI